MWTCYINISRQLNKTPLAVSTGFTQYWWFIRVRCPPSNNSLLPWHQRLNLDYPLFVYFETFYCAIDHRLPFELKGLLNRQVVVFWISVKRYELPFIRIISARWELYIFICSWIFLDFFSNGEKHIRVKRITG